ncbi:sulfatase-like hydrolase/transferase [Tamlana agarivorans]|uniref:Sulfatase-like hydrolase/transferase n=1 Tax=Pseudotamlana agarivorans TaxID=481183 RepID=A0ACC5U9C3_9FLAO|nr:sulfatase-like hydrolase/transferase [Tamlana agarivorans]MBU2950932.1 sulfatase-like hydrolase/transferase [Tamlana agarivorans]
MKNIKYFFILLSTAIMITSCSKDEHNKSDDTNASTSKPNILLIIADDFGLDASPNYNVGTTKPNMPHLQELSNNGITFDNCWAFPMCSATRASILTGKYGVKTGVLNATDASTINANEKTLQAYLDDQLGKTYSHSIIGKWHLSNGEPNRPTEMGIDYFAGLLTGGTKSYNSWNLVENGISNPSTEYITTKTTNLAIDWIKNQDKNWFCWLAYTVPHTPFHLPPNHMHSQGNLPTDQGSIDANPLPYFMAMAESMDYEIGRLLDNIPQDERENTIIIFIGDNGTAGQVIQNPYVSNRSKGSVYQGGIAVPLIISGKGVSRFGVRDNNLISSTDLFATIANIAGVNVTDYENSKSFYGLLNDDTTTKRTYNYSEVLNDVPAKSGYTIRNDIYKLICLDNDAKRFYNLIADPFETNNLLTNLSTEEEAVYNTLLQEANRIRN